MFSPFSTVPTSDERTDGRTDTTTEYTALALSSETTRVWSLVFVLYMVRLYRRLSLGNLAFSINAHASGTI